jgi:CBS domain-containing protein
MILDIGTRTVARIGTALEEARTLVWNGPLGAFETPPFDRGTLAVAKRAAELTQAGRLLSVAGGGDTVAALAAAGLTDELSYVSTAGGAFLEWLEGRELPGVAALSDPGARSRKMKASDVMTRDGVTVGRETSVAQAIRLMLDNNISGLPVLHDGKVVGILTEGDLLRRIETGTERHRPRWLEILMGPGRMAGEYVRTHGRKVEEIMTTDVISVTGDTPLDEVVGLMERRRIKRVPVIEGDVLLGVVSRLDLLRAVLGAIEAQHSEDRGDEEIQEQILAELAKAAWVPRDGLSISVKNGVVDLHGVILEEKEREALRVAAENVPGVKAVEDHLVWIEPVSGTVFDSPQDQRTPTHR